MNCQLLVPGSNPEANGGRMLDPTACLKLSGLDTSKSFNVNLNDQAIYLSIWFLT